MDHKEKTQAIKDRAVGFTEDLHLTGVETRINQEMMRLDHTANNMESRWGYGRLVELAPKDLQDKWNSQISKLNDAIEARDANTVTGLVDGCVRGWGALEASAERLGHVSMPPYQWGCEIDGTIYKIARTQADASAINKRNGTTDVLALEEVCRVYASRSTAVLSNNDIETQELKTAGKLLDDELPF